MREEEKEDKIRDKSKYYLAMRFTYLFISTNYEK